MNADRQEVREPAMASAAQYSAYRFGSFILNLEQGALLTADGAEIPLRPKSFALLQLLVENAGRLLSREAILETLWPDLFVTEYNVTQCIHDIRAALGPGSHQMLRTLPRRGYLFATEVAGLTAVQPVRQDRDPAGRETTMPIGNGSQRAEADQGRRDAGPRRTSSLSRLSVVVMPLRNLGVLPDHERLAESVIEDIAAGLLFWGAVVISHAEDVYRQSNQNGPVAIARELGVGYALQPSVRGAADHIGLNLQLMDGETGVHLLSEHVAIDPQGSAELRAESAARTAWALYRELTKIINRRIEALSPEEWTANDFVSRGRALLFRPVTADNRSAAIRHFERALAADPGLLGAKVGWAVALIMDISDSWGTASRQDEAQAEELLLDILRIDANISIAHLLMGVLRRIQGRLYDSRIALEIAVRLAPNSANALAQLGATLIALGEPEAAMPLLERSLRLSPHDFSAPIYHSFLGLGQLLLNNVDESIASQRTARTLNPSMHYIHWGLAAAQGLKGELDEANAALRQAIEMRPELVSPPVCYVLTRRPTPRFITLFEARFVDGLRRAGLPDMGT